MDDSLTRSREVKNGAMGLSVDSFLMSEILGQASAFPKRVRQCLCDAVQSVSVEDMAELATRHESDRENFDGVVERNLRKLLPGSSIAANVRVSGRMRFDNDLVVETDSNAICVEIEKGNMSRFEFDILKMQAFADARRGGDRTSKAYGAFVVPMDNIVARHITGNTNESSFEYLKRLARLVGQIVQTSVADILVVGYGISAPTVPPKKGKSATTDNVVIADRGGLLPDEVLAGVFHDRPMDLVRELRKALLTACPSLREKINRNTLYLGYAREGRGDALYVYVQKKHLQLHVRVSQERGPEFRQQGFQIKPVDNYQSKAGWLTGLLVPHDTDRLEIVVRLALDALQN